MLETNTSTFPEFLKDAWDKLIAKGRYISAETDRALYNDIVRNEDQVAGFFAVFDHRLVVHNREFVYAEDLRNKPLLKFHRELLTFLAVFIERYRQKHPSLQKPWYDEIVVTSQSLNEVGVFTTDNATRRLQEVGLYDERDIYERVLKPAADMGLIRFNPYRQAVAEDNEDFSGLDFQFQLPIHRFIDIFINLADEEVASTPAEPDEAPVADVETEQALDDGPPEDATDAEEEEESNE